MHQPTRRSPLPAGKLPPQLLERLLAKNHVTDPRVVVGPQLGEDAAALDFGRRLVVVSTDPITFAADLIGWYAVHVNANDIAVMGAIPRWFLCTLLLPEGTSEHAAEGIFDQLLAACDGLGVSLVGGHAEVTVGLDRPVAVGTMIGEAPSDSLVRSSGVRRGDEIILAGHIAIEGTALLAREHKGILRALGICEAQMIEARQLLLDPGISIVRAAAVIREAGKPDAMHDPTEGGLATGLRELATASRVGMEIDEDSIPVLPLCREFCRRLRLKPLGLIASGSLLIAAPRRQARAMVMALLSAGIPASVIGRAVPESRGISLIRRGKIRPLPRFARDEITRLAGG